ncbi:hypothetical protein C1645_775294 [Glomus cerebriforme]|uniref:Uncharacterized protein n=1 Tax=Glomus cerebriforme TaxID=658196 RepID=A0A397SZP5_9GLOM|nr:hypothetical protein C1645_775294 [Glomus cerebriforme]
MNEIQKSTLFNIPAFVIFGFSNNGSKFDIKKYVPRIANFKFTVFKKHALRIANSESTILKSKKFQLTILVVLGILVYHFISSRYIGKDQKTVKGKMHQKDFDDSNVRPVRPQRRKPSKYDPTIDYDELVLQLLSESEEGKEFAEDIKRIMEL